MKMHVSLLLLFFMALSGSALALPEVILGPGLDAGRTPYHVTDHITLSADTLYTLTGLFYIEPDASITIEAGTVCKGDTAATLIIKPGGQIFANGTEDEPIVFTSRKAPGERASGDWGGIVILGNAPTNQVNPLIEGGIIEGTYGGTDSDDDSGVFKYVRIDYPGYRFQLNNEINGLTMGGVGRGTELHHVQVSYSDDDSFEFFGGTVNAKYLVALGGTDDEFDTDFGFTGNLQYCFGYRDPKQSDPTGSSNGFESDNEGSSTSTAEPYTHPIFCNTTLVGPCRTDAWADSLDNNPDYADETFKNLAVIRRSTRTSVFNSVLMGYPRGISLRDPFTIQWAQDEILRWENVSCQAHTYVDAAAEAAGTCHDVTKWDGVDEWFTTPAYFNIGNDIRMPSSLMLTDMSSFHHPNPVPATGSELIDSASFADEYLQDGFFDVVTYRGAFNPALPMEEQWTARWTNFNPNGFGTTVDVEQHVGSFDLHGNYPNPFNPTTTISFSLAQDARIDLSVFSLQGRKVRNLAAGKVFAAGQHNVSWDGKDDSGQAMASGVYFYRLQSDDVSRTQRMMLLK